MQIDQNGAPVITSTDDQIRLDTFLTDIADIIYGRLPWIVRRFLPVGAFEALLHWGGAQLAQKKASG